MKSLNHFLFIFILFTYFDNLNAENPCQGWIAFKDEKCYRILDDTARTFEEAMKSCATLENESTLPIIHTKEEQDFLTDYLFNKEKKVDNFWIGARFSDGKYRWVDNSDLSYTNWYRKDLKNKENYCIQLDGDDSVNGKWFDEPCQKKNTVVCQKIQTWTLAHFQRTFIDLRKKLTDDFDNLRQNLVPIGFIYPQIPNEKSPVEIWPWMKWTDVSATYAGVFFRVTGGEAAAFGQVQAENAPRLDQVYTSHSKELKNVGSETYMFEDMSIPRTGWSNGIVTGASYGSYFYTQFKLSTGEVRPRNMAIRIWKRTG